jgi:hypothetical protein
MKLSLGSPKVVLAILQQEQVGRTFPPGRQWAQKGRERALLAPSMVSMKFV